MDLFFFFKQRNGGSDFSMKINEVLCFFVKSMPALKYC